MTCLHICNDFLGSKVHQNLYSKLERLGTEQTIFYPLRSENIQKVKGLNSKFPFKVVVTTKSLKRYHRIFFRTKINYLYKELNQQLQIETFDLVHATTLYSDGALAYKIFKKYKIPYIITVRATDINIFLKFRPDLLPKVLRILGNAQNIIFISNSLYHRFFSNPSLKSYKTDLESKCHIICNGIDDFWIKNKCKKQPVKPNKIIYVGSLISRKNCDVLSKSIIELAHGNPEQKYTLTIVGDGPLKGTIKKLAKKNPNIIYYIESISDKEKLMQILRAHHIFAMPSVKETFGLVYIEALSQGLPVIGVENEGIYGVFTASIGVFAKDSSLQSIKKSIIKTVNEYSNFNIDDINLNRFNWSTIAREYYDLYQKAIQPSSEQLN